jgi:hypothetical protein
MYFILSLKSLTELEYWPILKGMTLLQTGKASHADKAFYFNFNSS